MLECRDISLIQDTFELRADLQVSAGKHIAIVGPSGAGKSTLLAIIGGFQTPSQGQVLIDGRDQTHDAPQKRPIAHLFQDNNLFPHLTAAQNVALGIKPGLKLSKDEKHAVDAALKTVGLEGLGARRPAALSGGQQSRVALARVMVQKKPLVLLDEPFAALGPSMRQDMIALAKDVGAQNGATMLMVTHDVQDVARFADEVIWVCDGLCHAPQSWQELMVQAPQGFDRYIGR